MTRWQFKAEQHLNWQWENEMLRVDRTLYELQDVGNGPENRWSAFVQPGRGVTVEDALEVAVEIKRRWDCHDALIEALKAARFYVDDSDHECSAFDLDRIDEALKFAQGE